MLTKILRKLRIIFVKSVLKNDPYTNKKFVFIQNINRKKVKHLIENVDYKIE